MMTIARGLLLATLTALTLAVLVPAGDASAALPTKNTTYKDTFSPYGGLEATVTVKVGEDNQKIAKLVVELDCEYATDKVVFKNIAVKDNGTFSGRKGGDSVIPDHTVSGKFVSKHKAKGQFASFDYDCSPGVEFTVKD